MFFIGRFNILTMKEDIYEQKRISLIYRVIQLAEINFNMAKSISYFIKSQAATK
jgi:hypothetical protein